MQEISWLSLACLSSQPRQRQVPYLLPEPSSHLRTPNFYIWLKECLGFLGLTNQPTNQEERREKKREERKREKREERAERRESREKREQGEEREIEQREERE